MRVGLDIQKGDVLRTKSNTIWEVADYNDITGDVQLRNRADRKAVVTKWIFTLQVEGAEYLSRVRDLEAK